MMTNAPLASLCVAAKLEDLALIRRFVKDAMAALGNELLLIKRLEEDSEDLDICDRKRDCST